MTTPRPPDLSVVVTCRNDDHGGSPLARLQAFVNAFNAQCARTGLNAEVIIVEWNPPPDRRSLAEAIAWPAVCACAFRVVSVPPELHRTIRFSEMLPLYQMIAKNAGIRRAAGRFILVTNIDIIFSDALIDYLASGALEPGCVYRANRHDIDREFPIDAPLAEQMAFCRTHQIRVHRRWGSYPVEPDGSLRALANDIVRSPAIRLGEGWHVWQRDDASRPFRWASSNAQLAIDAAAGAVLQLDLESHPCRADSWFELTITDAAGAVLERTVVRGRRTMAVTLPAGGAVSLRVTDGPELREELPYFEIRDELRYRVWGVSLRSPGASAAPSPAAMHGPASVVRLPLDALLAASSHASVTPAADGTVGVVTGPDAASYATELRGRAPESAEYAFTLEYRVDAGDLGFGVLSGSGQRWLAVVNGARSDLSNRTLTVRAVLGRGESFRLMTWNNGDEGRRSTVAITALTVAAGAGRRAADFGIFPRGAGVGRASAALQRFATRVRDGIYRRGAAWLPAALIEQSAQHLTLERACVAGEANAARHEAAADALRTLAPLAPHAAFLSRERPDCLHLNACGDFQLAAREHWFDLHGYAEMETFSMNVDGLFSYMAHAAGFGERVLDEPCCIYHVEHDTGSGWTPEGESVLRQRIDDRGIPWVDGWVITTWASYMHWMGRPLRFNGDRWGFSDQQLREFTVTPCAGS